MKHIIENLKVFYKDSMEYCNEDNQFDYNKYFQKHGATFIFFTLAYILTIILIAICSN